MMPAIATDVHASISSTEELPHIPPAFEEMLKQVTDVIAPVWPLQDYVAVNPYFGISDRSFLGARAFLRVFSDCETLMPVEYYAAQFRRGQFSITDIDAAIEELDSAGITNVMAGRELAARLESLGSVDASSNQTSPAPNPHRYVRTIAEYVTEQPGVAGVAGVDWSEAIRDEVCKYCAAHYDDGQASWRSPWKHLPLYQAWRTIAEHDRNVEALGLIGFRRYVSKLPHTPEAAIVCLLQRLNVPRPLWSTFLLCQAFSIPGWCAWAKHQDVEQSDRLGNDLAGLLAMRLAYDAALSECFALRVNWDAFVHNESASFPSPTCAPGDDSILRYTLLRASEIGQRSALLGSLASQPTEQPRGKLAQIVFCIDVRSERIRRQLESLTDEVETFGFAGFFGMPIEFVALGESCGKAQLPVLLKPQFKLHEGLHAVDTQGEAKVLADRHQVRTWRKLWRGFQASALGCFSFVETTGLWFGFKLLARALGFPHKGTDGRFDGLSQHDHDQLGPTLRSLDQQGLTVSRQADLAEAMLKNLGLTKNFARLVVLCGHSSQTENNPLAAGLDCGACGGHSGEPNARMAAMLLNQPSIRSELADRGLEIPSATHFLAGLHNTTTDQIQYFDLDEVPATHGEDLRELQTLSTAAGQLTCEERMPSVRSRTVGDMVRRAGDWSEVRPEWGLAGNAAFIVAPRWMTKDASLNGRSFLHSYDYRQDPHGTVLELIMTAPMVVANWINMQYYASTVDNHHFGSGNKTVHNVVGRFGILSGNGGDLMTGLPWQSLHTGDSYQHQPMRLQVVIAAPRESIECVIEKHEVVANLLKNGWLHLVAVDDGEKYRYTEAGTWQALEVLSSDPLLEAAP